MEQAREIGEEAQQNYDEKIKELDEIRNFVNKELCSLGEYKKDIFQKTIGYIVCQVKNARSSIQGFDEHITSIDIREVDIFDRDLAQLSALDISNGAAQGLSQEPQEHWELTARLAYWQAHRQALPFQLYQAPPPQMQHLPGWEEVA